MHCYAQVIWRRESRLEGRAAGESRREEGESRVPVNLRCRRAHLAPCSSMSAARGSTTLTSLHLTVRLDRQSSALARCSIACGSTRHVASS